MARSRRFNGLGLTAWSREDAFHTEGAGGAVERKMILGQAADDIGCPGSGPGFNLAWIAQASNWRSLRSPRGHGLAMVKVKGGSIGRSEVAGQARAWSAGKGEQARRTTSAALRRETWGTWAVLVDGQGAMTQVTGNGGEAKGVVRSGRRARIPS